MSIPSFDEDDPSYQYRSGRPKNFPGLVSKTGLLGHLRATHLDTSMSPIATIERVKAHHRSLHSASGPLAIHTHKA